MSRNVTDDDDGDLSAKQARAAWLIASGKSRVETAAEVGIDRRTLTRWLHDPAFRAALDDHLDEFDAESRTMARALRTSGIRVAAKALRKMEAALDNDNAETSYQAAVDALRASGVARAAGLMERIEARSPADAPAAVAFYVPEELSMEEWTARAAREADKPTNGAH